MVARLRRPEPVLAPPGKGGGDGGQLERSTAVGWGSGGQRGAYRPQSNIYTYSRASVHRHTVDTKVRAAPGKTYLTGQAKLSTFGTSGRKGVTKTACGMQRVKLYQKKQPVRGQRGVREGRWGAHGGGKEAD